MPLSESDLDGIESEVGSIDEAVCSLMARLYVAKLPIELQMRLRENLTRARTQLRGAVIKLRDHTTGGR